MRSCHSESTERIFDHLRIAETLARRLNDQRRLGRAFAYLAEYFRMTGEPARAVESGERALALATALGDFALQVMATFFLGAACSALGEYRRAVDYFSRNVASLTGELLRERFGMTGLPAVMSRTWLVSCLADLGEFDEGIARGDEAMRLAEAAEHPFSLTQAYYALGTLFLRQGDLPKAIPVLERGLGLCQAAGILTWFPTVAAALGYAYTLSGRVPEALPLLQQAVAQDPSKGISAGHARRVAYLSEAYLLAGRRDEAADLATSALTFARTLKAGETRPTRCGSTGRSTRSRSPWQAQRPTPTISRPSLWPRNSGCVHSRPTATWLSVPCLPREASWHRHASNCPQPLSCSTRWG